MQLSNVFSICVYVIYDVILGQCIRLYGNDKMAPLALNFV